MDLHQEAMAAVELTLDTPWGPPAMPELRPRTGNRSESNTDGIGTIPRRWMGLSRSHDLMNIPKLTKEASTSMEDLSFHMHYTNTPGNVARPKSMCVPDMRYFCQDSSDFRVSPGHSVNRISERIIQVNTGVSVENPGRLSKLSRPNNLDDQTDGIAGRRLRPRRNPVQRAASRLYRAGSDVPFIGTSLPDGRDCVGPEFVVRASLPNKQLTVPDTKGNARKTVTVIMLNGQKLDVHCNPGAITAGRLFEVIIQKEHIEENFMLGLSALIAGDFVFLPSDTRISKAFPQGNVQGISLTLFMRVRFFLPSLRGVRGPQARHLLYLQLRRSILEHQLPCSFTQLIELDGLALQAEFGDYNPREHGARDYFLLEHYVPETMTCAIEDQKLLRQELIKAHMSKKGLEYEKAEQEFIAIAQTLPHYGGHFYTATWMLKDNNNKDIWLYISAQGINLYERGKCTSNCGPKLYEMFEWRSIQTLCYSKHYLCVLPHAAMLHAYKLKKYKLKMDHKKSYFTFRLASLHHQFFLRLRTEFTSLQSLSQQFGIPLKDIKNETNSLFKMEGMSGNEYMTLDRGTVNAETEFKIEFRASSRTSKQLENENLCKRSKSVTDFSQVNYDTVNEDFQNKENEKPTAKTCSALVLDSSCLSGLPTFSNNTDKRRGVKMGTRAISNVGPRVSRSMEAVNAMNNDNDDLEELSLLSISLHCSSTSMSRSPTTECVPTNEAYILDSSIKSTTDHFLPDFQESISDTLLEKLNNISFAEERILSSVTVKRDTRGSLGLQITEGSDGNVYVQSVIIGGPAYLTGKILNGDQVVSVDGQNLLGMKYSDALNFLKNRGESVDFIFSRIVKSKRNSNIHSQSTMQMSELENLKSRTSFSNLKPSTTKLNRRKQASCPIKTQFEQISGCIKSNNESPIEKHLTENCRDISNFQKYGTPSNPQAREVPYHKHIRYEIEPERSYIMSKKDILRPRSNNKTNTSLNRTLSKSCTNLPSNDRAVVVEMIPKSNVDLTKIRSLDRKLMKTIKTAPEEEENFKIPPIALPRSLGLSRKWRGPVRYPVTPIKKVVDTTDTDSGNYLSTSDDEQVFI